MGISSMKKMRCWIKSWIVNSAYGGLTVARQLKYWRSISILAILTLSACSEVKQNHGYVPDESELAKIEIGQSTKETVSEIMGYPLAIDDQYDETWIYVESSFTQKTYREPVMTRQQVVAFSFNNDGRVKDYVQLDLDDGKYVAFQPKITKTYEGRVRFIDQVMRAFGRVDVGRILDDGSFRR